MDILKKCDTCGKIGDKQVVWFHPYAEQDFCEECRDKYDLRSLREDHAKLEEWLEKTHLGKLKAMEVEIAKLELKISGQLPPP